MPVQCSLELPMWGGRRRGAGRPAAGERRRASHVARETVRAAHPVHVSVRMAAWVWNLRSERSFAVFDAAVRGVRDRRTPGWFTSASRGTATHEARTWLLRSAGA